jgi:hypothetical protein
VAFRSCSQPHLRDLGRNIPRQQFFDAIDGMVCDALQHVAQVAFGVEVAYGYETSDFPAFGPIITYRRVSMPDDCRLATDAALSLRIVEVQLHQVLRDLSSAKSARRQDLMERTGAKH